MEVAMTDPYRQQGPHGPGPQPNGVNQPGPQYAGQSHPGAEHTGPIPAVGPDPNAPAGRSQLMPLRVLIAWIVVMVPIAYGIYMTLIAVPPLFQN
jgi:hypothetical protein